VAPGSQVRGSFWSFCFRFRLFPLPPNFITKDQFDPFLVKAKFVFRISEVWLGCWFGAKREWAAWVELIDVHVVIESIYIILPTNHLPMIVFHLYIFIYTLYIYIYIYIHIYIFFFLSIIFRVPKNVHRSKVQTFSHQHLFSPAGPSLRAPTERCTNWSKFTDTTSVPSGGGGIQQRCCGSTFRFQGVGHQISPQGGCFFPKIGGKKPKMDGENHGKTPSKMDDLGKHPYFLKTL